MTDLETMRAMLQRAKIEFEETEVWGETAWDANERQSQKKEAIRIKIETDAGYMGFYTTMLFNLDGSLKEIAAWE